MRSFIRNLLSLYYCTIVQLHYRYIPYDITQRNQDCKRFSVLFQGCFSKGVILLLHSTTLIMKVLHYQHFQFHSNFSLLILFIVNLSEVLAFISLIPSYRVSTVSSSVSFSSLYSKYDDTDRHTKASFQFVPYGSSILKKEHDETFYISCDGKVPGDIDLELTHWTNNLTPDEYYADTSTEIALKYLHNCDKSMDNGRTIKVVNNHYDTDGVLSVWICLQNSSDVISKNWRRLLTEGAEAGDFGEWSSDEGVKLDCALSELLEKSGDEELAYCDALNYLPNLLESLSHDADDYDDIQNLWKVGFDEALGDWQLVQNNNIQLNLVGRVVIVEYETDRKEIINSYALDRSLRSMGLGSKDYPGKVTRVLHIFNNGNDEFKYIYQKPGYGWVKRLVDRKTVSDLEDAVVEQLNDILQITHWKGGGDGLTSLCYTKNFVKCPPNSVIDTLLKLDKHAF